MLIPDVQETDPPFVKAMGDFLVESGLRAFRPTLVTNMMGYNAKYEQDIQIMADLANKSMCPVRPHIEDGQ